MMTDPPKRGKSKAQVAYDKAHNYTTYQVKLNTFLQPQFSSELGGLFAKLAIDLSTILLEGYQLANLHIVKSIHENKELPTLNQTFFYQCLTLVCGSTRIHHDELVATTEVYRTLRPSEWKVPDTTNLNHVMCSMAREMVTATTNHIVLNLVNRLVRYVRIKYALDSSMARSFIGGCFMSTVLTEDQKRFKAWIQFNPYFESEVKANLGHFIKILAEILTYYETLPSDTKYVKRFTLLPQKGDYIPSFFFIDKTTLPELLNLLDHPIQKKIVQSMMLRVPESERTFLEVRLKTRVCFTRDFQQNPELAKSLWSTLFRITKQETMKRKFAYKIQTNGYAVTVYLQKPKIPTKECENEFDLLKHVKDTTFETYLGLDPGTNYPATVFGGEMNGRKSKCVQVSTTEIHVNSQVVQRRTWDKQFRKNNQEYTKAIGAMSSLKTANVETMKERLRVSLALAVPILKYSQRNAFRAWRFKVARFDKQAIHKAVKKLVPKPETTLVGFGDWSRKKGFKCGEPAPCKKLRKAMRKAGVKVIEVSEFRTSISCSACCSGTVENVYYDGKFCHEIVRCGNSECGVYWQRDVNASRNIREVLMALIKEQDRPLRLKRQKPACQSMRAFEDACHNV
jgi:transposase